MTVAAPTLGRLTEVELRKMTDTRAGRWLLGVVALAAVALVIVTLTAAPLEDRTWRHFLNSSQAGVAVLFPVIGILAVTAEWSQRTALTTFTLVPDRRRVLGAKLAAGGVLSAIGLVMGLVCASLGRLTATITHRGAGAWSIPLSVIASMLLAAVLSITIGMAFGMALLNAPPAIVAYFMIPSLLAILANLVSAMETTNRWINPGTTLDPLYDTGVTGVEWARLGTAMAIWLLGPLLAGTMRVIRTEVH
ncbi:ABC transporter permease [Embleya scabrispora]|uniref:ABC transporter permease n=1 Tax=Embleya scabrispora TaxID=159449 RepID=UPI0003734522|nr:ABC transporter permease [Embleya scabrispora]MYS84138.1 ABC transporter permease [Streptomyces sp. SID5474]